MEAWRLDAGRGGDYSVCMSVRFSRSAVPALAALALFFAPAAASAAPEEATFPHWASLRASEVNMRVGPGEDYRINWVYHRQHMPVKVLRGMEGWRLVEDPDGARGWMMLRFLSKERDGMIAKGDLVEMHEAPDGGSRLLWRLEPGVVGKLGDCAAGWCKFDVNGRAGYVMDARIWGAGAP